MTDSYLLESAISTMRGYAANAKEYHHRLTEEGHYVTANRASAEWRAFHRATKILEGIYYEHQQMLMETA